MTLHSLHFTLHILNFTFDTLLHSTLYAPYPTLYTPRSTLNTPHPTLYTLHSTLNTSHSTLYTPHSTLYTLNFTLYTLRSALYTPHSTLHTLHSTLHTSRSTLHTLDFTVHALHCTLHFTPSQLYTFHTLHCMEPWPSFIFMLRPDTYLSSSTSVLHCVTSSRASKGPLRCRRWTFESSPITSHHARYAEFPHPLLATVHNNHMFSSPSPTYIASTRRFGCSPYEHAPASDPLVHIDEKAAQLRCALCVFMLSSLPS